MILGTAILAFCFTDLDDLFVLALFFADKNIPRRDIVVGQFGGIAVLYALSVLGALTSLVIPKAWIGSLGLIPIIMGVLKLRALREAGSFKVRPKGGNVFAVFAVTVANGGDNLGSWIPLFATWSARDITVAGLAFAVLTAIWCLGAQWLVDLPALRIPLGRYGARMVPFALIGMGIFILLGSGGVP